MMEFWGAASGDGELEGLRPLPQWLSCYWSYDWAPSHVRLGANGSVAYRVGDSVIRAQPVILQMRRQAFGRRVRPKVTEWLGAGPPAFQLCLAF